ncbi:peptidylprolyl isomerase [Algicella marina]|nr:peptidylprolyl isomerase [Algicella marina]
MLGSFRTSGKGKTSQVLLWVVMALLAFGLAGYSLVGAASGLATTNVASVGDQKISRQDYLTAYQAAINNLQRQLNIPINNQQARAFGIDRQVLAQLITQAALEGEAADLGISAGDDAVREEILAKPEFTGPAGRFEPETYSFVLQRTGLSAPEYEEKVRRDLARSILEAGISGGVLAPDILADTLLAYQGEQRVLSYAILSANSLPEPVGDPTEEQLRTFYDENPEAYTVPETRVVSYVALTPEDMAATMEIPDEAVREAFDNQTARFNSEERRLIDRIVFGTSEQAEEARTRLDAGEIDFAGLAEERGLAPTDIELGGRTASSLTRAEADAIFAAEGPSIVGPVTTDLGPALFRINAIVAARSTPFEEAAPALRRELAEAEASAAIGDWINDVQDLLAGGASFEEIAAETPLTQGTARINERLGEGLAADPDFRAEAMAADPGGERDLIDIAGGGIAALRVEEIVPPTLRPYEDVAAGIPADWRVVAQQTALHDYATSLLARIGEGETFDSVAQDAGLGVTTSEPLRRNDAPEGLPPAILEPAFALEEGASDIFEELSGTYLFRVDQVVPFDPEDETASGEADAVKAQISNAIAFDLFGGFAQATQDETGASVNETLLDQTLSQLP